MSNSSRRSRGGSSRFSGEATAKKPPKSSRRPATSAKRPSASGRAGARQQRPGASRRPSSERSKTRQYRKAWRLPVGRSSLRIRTFMVATLVFVLVCLGRAVQLQAIEAQTIAAEAAMKMQNARDLLPNRGGISDRNGVVLATTEPAFHITADPDMVQTNGADKRRPMTPAEQELGAAAPEAVAKILSRHLGGSESKYLTILKKENSQYEEIARHVPASTWTAIEQDMRLGPDGEGKRRWYGLFAQQDPLRTYPNGALASNVIGFVNGEGVGVAGLEGLLNSELAGTPGSEVYDRSTYGRIPLGTNVLVPAIDGTNYALTLDADLQWVAQQALADGMSKSGAKTGSVLVMNPKNSEILAMATLPSFDSGKPGAADPGDLGNRSVTEAFEPGSTEKVLTMAALADSGLVTPDTRLEVPSRIASGGGYVTDSFEHGTIKLTARGVVAQSSNIGTIQLARQMDKDRLHSYLTSFGLGAAPRSGLPAEASGYLPGPDMADYTRDQISFGQGLSVSTVQMGAAVSAAVNGGTYHQPTIIKSATNPDGTAVTLPAPTSHQVISPEASSMVRDMMESVIADSKEDRSIPGYRTAGKSGTAQRYDANCKCYNGYTASFVGVAPAEDPQLLVYVVLDQPTNGNLGSQLALPVVNNVLQMALPRYNVLPSSTPAPERPTTWE